MKKAFTKKGFAKKGFTLIEIVLVLALMSIIGSISFISYKSYTRYKNTIDSQFYCNSIVNFLNNCKSYCRENRRHARLTFDLEKNEMWLDGDKNITLKLPSSIKLKVITSRNMKQRILINRYGFSNDAFTLEIEDGNGELHKITMRVGTSYVKIKK